MEKFLKDVENLEERVKLAIGGSVLMWQHIQGYGEEGDPALVKDVCKIQIDVIGQKIEDIERNVEEVKKAAYMRGISYAEVEDNLTIVVVGLKWLKDEKYKNERSMSR